MSTPDVVQLTPRAVPGLRRFLGTGFADLLLQQAVWWSAVVLVRADRAELAALPALMLISATVWSRGWLALRLAVLGVAIGFVVDGALIAGGAMTLAGPLDAGLTSTWMLGLWAAFAIAFSASLRWVSERSVLLAFAVGGLGGVLAYRAGERLEVLAIAEGLGPLLAIALAWSLAVVALRFGARRLITSCS